MRIIFFSPHSAAPIGGVKVLYKHSEFLRDLGFESFIYHPRKRDFRGWAYRFRSDLGLSVSAFQEQTLKIGCDWFEHNASLRPTCGFDPDEDFLVIPEIWAREIGGQALRRKFRYAIYVQNGYIIASGSALEDYQELKKIYEAALGVFSISEDTTRIINLAFPKISSEKIFRLIPHVGEKFNLDNKEKNIVYMPRKLSDHADRLLFFLRQSIPSDWSVTAIHNQSEESVASTLGKSSVFLSFSHLEGCPLPPLEAALSGNLVVGYTGGGAKEYFCPPIFTEISYGDFRSFVSEVQRSIGRIERSSEEDTQLLKEARMQLRLKYCEPEEKRLLKTVFDALFVNL